MLVDRCVKTAGVWCVRTPGHAGVCTACPSSATLDWDDVQDKASKDAAALQLLDFETPAWADLRDDVSEG